MKLTATGLVRQKNGTVQAKLLALKLGETFRCFSWESRKYGAVARRVGIKLSYNGTTETMTRIQ